MTIVKTTVKGQVVIPAKIRNKYHITSGTEVAVIDRNGEIVLKPLLKDPIKEGKGIFKGGSSALKALKNDRTEESKR